MGWQAFRMISCAILVCDGWRGQRLPCAHYALPGFGASLLANKVRESSERSVPDQQRCDHDHKLNAADYLDMRVNDDDTVTRVTWVFNGGPLHGQPVLKILRAITCNKSASCSGKLGP